MGKSKTPVEMTAEIMGENMEAAKAMFSPDNTVARDSMEALSKSASLYQARMTELQSKWVEFAEANAKAAFGFWKDAVTTKSADQLLSLQQTFFKSQSETVMQQAKGLNDMTMAMLRETAQPVQDNFSKAFAAFQPKKAA